MVLWLHLGWRMSDKELDVSSEDYVIVVPDEKEGNGSNCSLQKESR